MHRPKHHSFTRTAANVAATLAAMVSYASRPEIHAKLSATYKPKFNSPEENLANLTKEIARWKDVIERAKIKVD